MSSLQMISGILTATAGLFIGFYIGLNSAPKMAPAPSFELLQYSVKFDNTLRIIEKSEPPRLIIEINKKFYVEAE